MKKILVGLALTGILFTFSACGNKSILDTTYRFNYAEFERPNGEVVSGKVLKWKDYEGEQVQLKMEDGNVYIVNSSSNKLILSVDPF